MTSPIGSNEIRLVIRPIEPPGFEPELIPAQLFKKIYDAFLAALLAADREINAKSVSSTFLISFLAMGSYEIGIAEKQKSFGRGGGSAIELFMQCAGRLYRSDYQLSSRYPRLTRAFRRIAKTLDPSYVVLVQHRGTELPMDHFFCRQVDRAGGEAVASGECWFAGAEVSAFAGRLGEIDYRGPVWRGQLLLFGSDAQIECVFERSRGEDAFNPFGNKNVSVTGRAIYTGDSPLPERVEVATIEVKPEPETSVRAPPAAAGAD